MSISRKISIPKQPKVRSESQKQIESFGRLGREIRITPKAHISVNQPGFSIKYYTNTVDVLIGIGKDHTATLIMDEDAWEALKSGAKIDITTTEEWKNKYERPIRKTKSKNKV